MKQSTGLATMALSMFCAASLISAEVIRQDFNSMDELNAFWDISSWTTDGNPEKNFEGRRTHSANNLTIADGILDLKLSGSQPGDTPVCAEITSKRGDFLYGSYRASIKTTATPGAVIGWFLYAQGSGENAGAPGDTDLHEIDVEILTNAIDQIYFTLHHVEYEVDNIIVPLAFDPSAAFHEYRWDWAPGIVDYYIDSVHIATLATGVPDAPMNIMINHWSGNIEFWGGPAPAIDVHMYVDYMEYLSPDAMTAAHSLVPLTAPSALTVRVLQGGGLAVEGIPNAGQGLLSLVDLEGREIMGTVVNEGRVLMHLPKGLSRGAYLLRYEGRAGTLVTRLVY